jgi:hypothetical protein
MIFYKLPFGKRELFSVYKLVFLMPLSRKKKKIAAFRGIKRKCYCFGAVCYANAFFARYMLGDFLYDLFGRFKIGVIARDNAKIGKACGCAPKLASAPRGATANRAKETYDPRRLVFPQRIERGAKA